MDESRHVVRICDGKLVRYYQTIPQPWFDNAHTFVSDDLLSPVRPADSVDKQASIEYLMAGMGGRFT